MKNSSAYGTFIAGQLAVVAILFQGCQTYSPGGRTAFGGSEARERELDEGTVVTLGGDRKTATVAPVAVPAGTVGAPGTYPEFVLGGSEAKDPHAGLIKRPTRHVPAPPPSVTGPGYRTPSVSTSKMTDGGKYKIYVVKSGDTAGEIANSHGLRKAEFIKLNNIADANKIRVGQQFKVPADGKSISGGKSTQTASASGGNTYTVASGDTIGGIALKYRMKSSDLMAMNGITDPKKLRVGQKLRIGGSSSAPAEGAVKSIVGAEAVVPEVKIPEADGVAEPTGDALAPLLDQGVKNNPSSVVPEIKPAVVPAVTPPVSAVSAVAVKPKTAGTQDYTVREEDDIYSVALKFRVRPMDIRTANDLSGNTLVPGSVIKIPASAE